jgi:phytanoyl-CoA hydroxylase
MPLAPLVSFSDRHHARFMEQGYLRLGQVLSPDDLAAIQQRIDDIMLGRVRYANMRFQLDPTVADADTPSRMMRHQISTLDYRRIDDLEQDPLFLAYMQRPLFGQIARRYIGDQIAVFRSMFMNKPAGLGTALGWHQDVGVGWKIDTNPIVTVWTALDRASTVSGCMQVAPGSNGYGVINEQHFVNDEDLPKYTGEAGVINLEAEAGEAILLHNFLLHRSGVNSTGAPRRAFSCTYMDAATRSVVTGDTFPVLWGQGALDPKAVEGKSAESIAFFHG